MTKLEAKGYQYNGNDYTKVFGDYTIRVFISKDDAYIREILKNKKRTAISKFESVFDLENDEKFKEIIDEYNLSQEKKRIYGEDLMLSGLERERLVYKEKVFIDEEPEVELEPEEVHLEVR
jgi:hypothetical protein